MDLNSRVVKAYVDHFLPRDVVGPVIVVFSLEGVIDGVFSTYVPAAYETVGWGIIFLLALVVVTYWGTVDDPAVEELQDRIDDIEADERPTDDPS